jgi:hypothetical protein
MKNFEELRKELDEHFNDDESNWLGEGQGQIVFISSNRHLAQLYVLFIPVSRKHELEWMVDQKRSEKSKDSSLEISNLEYGEIPYVIAMAMVELGAKIIGEVHQG